MFTEGQTVICIDNKEASILKMGQVYTIESVFEGSEIMLGIKELPELRYGSFFSSRFIKYDETISPFVKWEKAVGSK